MRILNRIILADMQRIVALENLLASRRWHPNDPEPKRLLQRIGEQQAIMDAHMRALHDEERILPVHSAESILHADGNREQQ